MSALTSGAKRRILVLIGLLCVVGVGFAIYHARAGNPTADGVAERSTER